MKRILLTAIAMLITGMAMAIPAHPGKATVRQPDGTELTIRLIGDEYLHFNTTDDGYSIVRRADGYYVYAQKDGEGQLRPTQHVAHDPARRSADELAWLEQTAKYLTPKLTTDRAAEQQAEHQRRAKARQAVAAHKPLYDYNNFKGLILLIEYNDCPFSRDDIAQLIDDMANKENYSGYDNSTHGRFTGSVRDYFYDNSMGLFSPQFDVVGPIKINHSQYDFEGSTNAPDITLHAIEAADSLVDFSQYDGDNDGTVDMVYFIFAGLGANWTGNDSRLLWPHASSIYRRNSWNWAVQCDSVYLGRYACSTELYGTKSQSIPDGIGTICHEFSHVLGVMDLYDTDYEGSGGQSAHPSTWSIMAGGSYQNYSRTPVGYNAYERITMGFATPTVISEEGSYSLPAIGTSNMSYRINSPVKKEYFLFENRQKTTKWDRYLPGHGMLAYRVDSTSADVWRNNAANNNPKHNYFVLLRAGGANGIEARSSDPFPGTGGVTLLNNSTSPANLLTWAGKPCLLGLEAIKESKGEITFDVIDVNVLKTITIDQEAWVGCGLSLQLTAERYPDTAPYTLQWNSSNTSIATVSNDGLVSGLAPGEADITVTANGNAKLKAVCHVSVEEVPIANNIAEFKTLDANRGSALKLNDALVLFVHDNDVFLRDASGTIVLSATGLTFNSGDMLNGSIYGKLSNVNGIPVLLGMEGLTNDNSFTRTGGHKVTPREVSVADITTNDYGDLLTLKATQLEYDGAIWATGGKNKLRLYNTFKLKNISVPNNYEGKYFDVTGIYITNKLKTDIIDELALTSALVEVEAPVVEAIGTLPPSEPQATAHIYTADGRFVATTTVAALEQLNLRHGIYIVKTASRTWRLTR